MTDIERYEKTPMPEARPDMALRATAIHEAGHALAAWWNGQRIYNVTVLTGTGARSGAIIDRHGNRIHGCDGYAECNGFEDLLGEFTPQEVLDTPRLTDMLEREVLCCYAGPVAEATHSGTDLEKVMLQGGGRLDYQRAYDVMQVLPRARQAEVDTKAERRARVLVGRYWPAICALADLLQVAGTVDGETVNAFLKAATGKTPGLMEKALTDLDAEPADAGEGGKDGR